MSSAEREQWLTVIEMAKAAKCNHWTIRRAIDRGDLPACQSPNSRLVRVRASDFEKWLGRPRPVPAST